MNSSSVHIRAAPESERERLREAVQRKFEEFASVDHATVQVEWESEAECRTPQKHA